MRMLITTILLAILSRPLGAHFLLNAPPTLGFDDDNEGEAPCGGFDVDFDKGKVTDFHVGGDAIAVRSTHPEANWLFRATMEEDAKGNWTNLLPVVSQTGLGNYCEKDLMLPSLWAGSRGVLQIVQHGPDSTLYQCALVNFVSDSAPAPSACQNATGLSASFGSDSVLATLATETATATSMGSSAASATGSSRASSSASMASATASAATTSSPATALLPSSAGAGKMLAWWILVWVGTVAFGLLRKA